MSFISQTMTRRLLPVLLLGGSAALLTGCVVALWNRGGGGRRLCTHGTASLGQRGDTGRSLARLCLDRRLLGLGRRTLQLASRPLGHAATSRLWLA